MSVTRRATSRARDPGSDPAASAPSPAPRPRYRALEARVWHRPRSAHGPVERSTRAAPGATRRRHGGRRSSTRMVDRWQGPRVHVWTVRAHRSEDPAGMAEMRQDLGRVRLQRDLRRCALRRRRSYRSAARRILRGGRSSLPVTWRSKGIVASLCPKELTRPDADDYGYRPTVRARASRARCLAHASRAPSGGVAAIAERSRVSCSRCVSASPGREPGIDPRRRVLDPRRRR